MISFNPKKAAVIGANGAMGAAIGALLASFGDIPVYMVARDREKSKKGIEIAVNSVRSNSIRNNLIESTLSDSKKIFTESDLIIESVSESPEVKAEVNKIISSFPKTDRIIGTNTSGLSITTLAGSLKSGDRKNYFGIHFFNPPYKMPLCEIIPSIFSDQKMLTPLKNYLEKIILRKVIVAKDTPGFLANNLGFYSLNQTVLLAEKYKQDGGIDYIDYLFGRHTGRPISPIALIDFVGLDVHKAIIENIYSNNSKKSRNEFKTPNLLKDLISKNKIGLKSKGGFYTMIVNQDGTKEKLVYDASTKKYRKIRKYRFEVVEDAKKLIHEGLYKQAISRIFSDNSKEGKIIKNFIDSYIKYSRSLVPKITDSKEAIDDAMIYGFNWAPPSAYVNFDNNKFNYRPLFKT